MSKDRYGRRLLSQKRLTRRALLRASATAGVGAADLALVGCGDDDDEEGAAAVTLREYTDRFRGEDEGPLFLTISRWDEPRRPMNRYLLGTLFSRLGQRAGVHANPHRFRPWGCKTHPF